MSEAKNTLFYSQHPGNLVICGASFLDFLPSLFQKSQGNAEKYLYFANNSESGYDSQNHRAKSKSCNPKPTHKKKVAHLVLEKRTWKG